MAIKSRLSKLERAINIVAGAESTSMEADPRFLVALCGALPEEEIEAFTARWPEFLRLFEPPDGIVDPVEAAIQAAGICEVQDTGSPN